MKQLMPERSGDISSGSVGVTEQVNLAADSDPGDAPCTCLTHIRNVNYAIPDKNAGLVEKLHCAFLNYLRKNAD